MDITTLNRGELIDKLTVIYQLNRSYDNACQNLLALQEKTAPTVQGKTYELLEGRFGGSKGIGLFLALFCLVGIYLVEIFRYLLPFGETKIGLLFALALAGAIVYGLAQVCRKIINFVLSKMNAEIEANTAKQNRKINQHNQQLENEMTPYLQKMQSLQRQYSSVGIRIPKRYAATDTVGEILCLLQDGRASSWAGAVNLYEEELSRSRMESQMQKQHEDAMYMQSRMVANQQITNMLMAWNLSNTLMN